MPVYKRTYRSGQTVWHYVLDAPGSTRENRQQITDPASQPSMKLRMLRLNGVLKNDRNRN